MITRRRFLQLASGLAGATAGIGLYTWKWEPHWVEYVQRPLELAHLPPGLSDSKLVHLSDLHIGRQVEDAYLLHTFDAIKRLNPQIVVYTGDFVSFEGDALKHLRRLSAHLPRGSQGTFGVLGNHDYGPGWAYQQMAEGIKNLAGEAGVRVLRNEVAEVGELQIAGLDDLWSSRFHPERVLPDLDSKRAAVVLSHNPDTADLPVWGAYRGWILSGHTHGGQCKPPFLPAPLLPVRNRRYRAGEYLVAEGRRMYINRGLGHLMQVRFNVRPEVTVFSLKAVERS